MAPFDERLLLLLAAMALDAVFGDPGWIWRKVPHPVVLMGRAVASANRRLNRADRSPWLRRLFGVAAVAGLVAAAAGVGWGIARAAHSVPFGWILEVLAVAILLAQRSLYDHVAAVARALVQGDLRAARDAVAEIVGRDPDSLDQPGVARAAIESTAENLSDGVTAPAFWYILLGLPGLLACKAINTADSMIGYRTEQYRDFGWFAARFDDIANFVPARIAGLIICLVSPVVRGSNAFAVMARDARKHRSVNAGWPEAAMAAALGLSLAGPRSYPGQTVDDPWLNADGRRDAGARDIGRGLRIFLAACLAQALIVLLLWAGSGLGRS